MLDGTEVPETVEKRVEGLQQYMKSKISTPPSPKSPFICHKRAYCADKPPFGRYSEGYNKDEGITLSEWDRTF
jgi:hypothetical protein